MSDERIYRLPLSDRDLKNIIDALEIAAHYVPFKTSEAEFRQLATDIKIELQITETNTINQILDREA